MKSLNWQALYDYKIKRVAIALSIAFLALTVTLRLINNDFYDLIRFIDYCLATSLLFVVSTKEKIEDERTKLVRNLTTKSAYSILVFTLMFCHLFKLDVQLIYFALGSLLYYLVSFYILDYYNPDVLFKDEAKSNKEELLKITVIGFAVGFVLCITTLLIINWKK